MAMLQDSPTPSAVVFDLGKVLLDFDYRIAVHNIQKHSHISADELQILIDQSPLLYRYETNLITTEQFFSEIQSKSQFRGDLEQFREMFGDIFTPIAPMIALHAMLVERGIPTYAFSNTNHLAVGHIRHRFAFFQNFRGYILSCEHGAMKPDQKLYEVVERVSGRKGGELLYIDDRPENIVAGLQRGWQSILHEHPDRTIAAVQRSGLLAGAQRAGG
jgi:HAD superfamily hydrolase (TIGR01509 family)